VTSEERKCDKHIRKKPQKKRGRGKITKEKGKCTLKIEGWEYAGFYEVEILVGKLRQKLTEKGQN